MVTYLICVYVSAYSESHDYTEVYCDTVVDHMNTSLNLFPAQLRLRSEPPRRPSAIGRPF